MLFQSNMRSIPENNCSTSSRKRNFTDTFCSSSSAKSSTSSTKTNNEITTVPPASNANTTRDKPIIPAISSIKTMRLAAIFHPKFDNEQQCNSSNNRSGSSTASKSKGSQFQIREQMKQRVAIDDAGYLEVTLKHSGSLLLWSGGQHYFSKNSTNNIFTYAGEVLLRQHFMRANWKNAKGTRDNDAGVGFEAAYKECSDYVEAHELTLSFELVTSFLGDHGSKPKRDFLILTAVADRSNTMSSPRFYSTAELVALAHRFRLPHNDTWIFAAAGPSTGIIDTTTTSTATSVDNLFAMYDSHRETGTAETVVTALTDAANCTISSMYPHVDFQGDILEGIVIRYVPYGKDDTGKEGKRQKHNGEEIRRLERLSEASQQLRQEIPSDLPASFQLLLSFGDLKPASLQQQQVPAVLYMNIRLLYEEVKPHLEGGRDRFESSLEKLLTCSSLPGEQPRLCIDPITAEESNIDIPALAAAILREEETAPSYQSRQIAKVIQTLSNLSAQVKYSLFLETAPLLNKRSTYAQTCSTGVEQQQQQQVVTSRILCMINVLHDKTFPKFHRAMVEGDMPLFRGFAISLEKNEASTTTSDSTDQAFGDTGTICGKKNATVTSMDPLDKGSGEGGPGLSTPLAGKKTEEPLLMLKMKFLPYMVRTFCCRNGLHIIRQGRGTDAFVNYCAGLMSSKWSMSYSAQRKWQPFFRGWALYAKACFDGSTLLSTGQDNDKITNLPALTESCYLSHLEHFEELFYSGKIKIEKPNARPSGGSSFQGLVIVVALTIDIANVVANEIANELGGISLRTNLRQISAEEMAKTRLPNGGCICSTTFDGGVPRKLFNGFSDGIAMLMCHCSDRDIAESSLSSKEIKKSFGMRKAWNNTKCAYKVELPSFLANENNHDNTVEAGIRQNIVFKEVLMQLLKVSNEIKKNYDSRIGLLAFFPVIPGCGKSNWVGSSFVENMRATLCKMDKQNPRKVIVKVGDKTSKKFWQSCRQDRFEDGACLYVADKNAPKPSWGQIASICAATKGMAVPVLPKDAMCTVRVTGIRMSDGTFKSDWSHHYPFSLPFLAVCMARVLQRAPESHDGKLDSASRRACMVVVKFYSFYRNILDDEFCADLHSAFSRVGALVAPIEVPFFKNGKAGQNLPQDLEEVLVEALQSQVCAIYSVFIGIFIYFSLALTFPLPRSLSLFIVWIRSLQNRN